MMKNDLLRSVVLREIGLGDKDMVVMLLSSIYPEKGKQFLLDKVLLVVGLHFSLNYFARVNTIRSHDTISKDMVHRWSSPLVPDVQYFE